jgi:hypothetical protein
MLVELRVGEQRYRAVWEVLDGASVTEVARRFEPSRLWWRHRSHERVESCQHRRSIRLRFVTGRSVWSMICWPMISCSCR